MLFDDVIAGLAGDVRIGAEGADAERVANRQPGQRLRTVDAIERIEMHELRRLWHLSLHASWVAPSGRSRAPFQQVAPDPAGGPRLALWQRECQGPEAILSKAMPIYEYRCTKDHVFDAMQRFSDDALSKCEVCGAPAQRVFHAPAVHFKGSGFYNTDYGTRNRAREKEASSAKGESSSNNSSSDGSSSDSSSSDSSSSDKKESSKSASDSSSSGKKSEAKASATK
jgi:putative FmdB family regulatory protein